MPPQQPERLLDLGEEFFRFRAHGVDSGRPGGASILKALGI
jgi:hypothetical protein